MANKRSFASYLIIILFSLLPAAVVLVLMERGMAVHPLFLLFLLLLGGLVVYSLLMKEPGQQERVETRRNDTAEEVAGQLAEKVSDLIDLHGHSRENGNWVLRGRLLTKSGKVWAEIKDRFRDSDYTPLLQEDDSGQPLLVLMPGSLKKEPILPTKPWLNLLLLAATLLTTAWAGAAHQGIDLFKNPAGILNGLPYGLALMLILGAHELGHFFSARRHGIVTSWPWFIPVPFALGTFGAFIQIKSPVENRRALFDVGVAGPLAGLIFAVPALLIGLQYSTILSAGEAANLMHNGVKPGSSFLFAWLASISFSDVLAGGQRVLLHPLAFAGWLGLMVTALNLLPIGQLDGGHISHALFGRKNAHTIGVVFLFGLFLLGIFVWKGLLFWAIVIFFIAGSKSAPPLNDLEPLNRSRVISGLVAFLLLVLILAPVPHPLHEALGIECPYM